MKNVIAGLEEGLGAIATALEGDGYPKPTNVPQGKVLTADGDDGASWEDAPSGLPPISGSGEVLMTAYDSQDDEFYARWTDNYGQMPPYQYASAGDVLKLDSEGNPTWGAPSGGLPTITSSDNGKVLTSVYDDKSGSGYAEWQTPTGGSAVGHYQINIADLTYNDKAGTYSGTISIPIAKNIIGCNAVVVSSPVRTQCPVSQFTIEHDGSTTWETIVISSSVYSEISTDYVYIDIIYA